MCEIEKTDEHLPLVHARNGAFIWANNGTTMTAHFNALEFKENDGFVYATFKNKMDEVTGVGECVESAILELMCRLAGFTATIRRTPEAWRDSDECDSCDTATEPAPTEVATAS